MKALISKLGFGLVVLASPVACFARGWGGGGWGHGGRGGGGFFGLFLIALIVIVAVALLAGRNNDK